MKFGTLGLIVAVVDGKLVNVGDPRPLSKARKDFVETLRSGVASEVLLISSVHGVIKRRKAKAAAADGDGKKKGGRR